MVQLNNSDNYEHLCNVVLTKDKFPIAYENKVNYVNRSLEAIENRYFCNDFNCWIEAANGKDRLKFLNDAKYIVNEIETIKQERMKEVENALNAVDGL